MSARMETEPVSWESAEVTCGEVTGGTLSEIEVSKRDQMRTEIKRGRELLEQVQCELVVLRARLDEWAGYEVVCGKNPLSDYMQAIAVKERIEQYLPVWLKRREEQLHALDRQMEHHSPRGAVEQFS